MKLRIQSELTKPQIMTALESLRKNTRFFECFTKQHLEEFEAHFKFVSFKEKAQLTRRGEPVDFIGFIIKGSAFAIVGDGKVVIQEGDSFGFMACLKLQGSEVQQLDYFAREDGYLAFIKLEDVRLLCKRDPQFMSFLFLQLGLKTLDSVSNQFLGSSYRNHQQLVTLETSNKKIIVMLDKLGVNEVDEIHMKKKHGLQEEEIRSFRYFWNQLEQKEKRLFVQCSTLVELGCQDSLAKQYQKSDCFYIILQGELVQFEQNKLGSIYKLGDTIGVKQFLTGESYQNNIMGRSKSLLLKITQSDIQDMVAVSGLSACLIIAMLTRYEAQQVRQQFENEFQDRVKNMEKFVEKQVEQLKNPQKPLPKKEQFTTKQIMGNYFEIETNKIHQGSEPKELTIQQHVISPLYLLDAYTDFVAKRGYQPNEIKDRKDPMFESGLSIFLRDKANEQKSEAIKQKQLARQAHKSGIPIQQEIPDIDSQETNLDTYEQLNNDFYALVAENEKLKELVFLLEAKINEMKEEHKNHKEDLQRMQTQIRKNEIHKELLSLNLAAQLLMPTDKTLKKKITLYDNYQYQVQENSKFKRTAQIAEKILTLSQVHNPKQRAQ